MKHSAVVTGGASGVGLAIVRRLLDDGWPVAVVDADKEALAEAEDRFGDENAAFLKADVTDEDEMAEAFDEAVDRLGLIGGLVAAATVRRAGLFEDGSAEQLREILDVNVVGAFIAARAALARMGAGLAIVAVLPPAALRANAGQSLAATAGAAARALCEGIAVEYGHRAVRANCIATGPVARGRAEATDHSASLVERVPQARCGTPEEIAAAVSFLISPEASYVNGHTLAVDGGFSVAGQFGAR